MKNKDLHIVILAGGSGTRFWPLSRKDKPKQFLKIFGGKTLFQMTIERVRPAVSPENIWIVTNKNFLPIIKSQLGQRLASSVQLLLEPSGKNTAPAIAWAASRIYKKNKNAVMAVLPADHLIQEPKAFLKHLKEAVLLARSHYLVTLGISPTRPETGYGYLKTVRTGQVLRVTRFIEKPDLSNAKKFLRSKDYYWNGGIFIWRAQTILSEFQKYLPKVYRVLSKRCDDASVRKAWHSLPGISIDYGILEKAKHVAAVAAGDMDWSDVGSWEALHEVLAKDKSGNVLRGNVMAIDSKNTLVMAGKRTVAAVGLEGFIVVDTDDAILICPKDRSQHVRQCAEKAKV